MDDSGASLDQPSDETIAIAAHAIYRRPGQDALNKLDLKATNTGRYNTTGLDKYPSTTIIHL